MKISEIRGYVFVSAFARHDKERGHLEAFELWSQTIGIVEAIYVDRLLRAGDDVDRDIIVASVLEDHQASVHLLEDEIERQIAIRHGGEGIDGIRVAAADEVP